MKQTESFELGGQTITLETGRMAKQADGSVLVASGNNIVLVTAVTSKRESTADFFPLTVEFSEKFYATGRIPGGYFKREGRPTGEAILNCRLIDRPIRPSFPEGYNKETQIVATILSYDGKTSANSLASIGASAALHISTAPFSGPTAAIQVAEVDGQLCINPSYEDLNNATLSLFMAGTRKGILMVEGEAHFKTEAEILEAVSFGHKAMAPIFDAQDNLREKTGNKPKASFEVPAIDADFEKVVKDFVQEKVSAALVIKDKMERYARLDEIKSEAKTELLANIESDILDTRSSELGKVFGDVKYNTARAMILKEGKRIDGRDTKTVRPIACEVAMLPRVHGSALFTRGETQVLGTVTLGTPDDVQHIDALDGHLKKSFMLHYNFPPYSVGEAGRMGGTSRRETGHGFLAERALAAVIPSQEDFPYVLRVVGEVMESNGSSSMGTVCSGTLALLDAGVPIKGNVSGIAMGLIKEGDDVAILTDILGDEDHLGDMDFKVAGTREGITAFQMDLKIDSISFDIFEKALDQAKDGRNHILDEMEKVMSVARGQVSEFAPRILTIKVKPEKVREVIGSGGKTIKGIVEATGVKINIEDDGTIQISSIDSEKSKEAIKMIEDIVAEPEVGATYKGKVVKVTDFGAFVEILPNTSGLLHISELAHERVRNVTDVINEGDTVDVKVLDVDRAGRMKLSRKALLPKDGADA